MNFKAKLLKKSIIILVLILVAGTAFGASGETMIIGGSVPLILTLDVGILEAADNLELMGAAIATDNTVQIATIDITTNNTAGWEFWIISTNIGQMINADGDPIDYALSYDGTYATAGGTPSLVGGLLYGEIDNAFAPDNSDSGNLSITYEQFDSYPAGYYSDQLTLLLRAK